MAEKKAKDPEEFEEKPVNLKEYWAEKVPFRAFKDNGKYKDDIFVGWNGRVWRIQRGKEVMIPRAVLEIILQSMEQDQRAAEYIEQQEEYYRAESRKYE